MKKHALVATEVEVPDRDDEIIIDENPIAAALRALQATNKLLTQQVSAREDMVVKLVALCTGNYTDMVEQRRADHQMMREYEKTHLENRKLTEELLDKRAERRRQAERERKQDELATELVGDARALLPIIINAIAGRKTLSEAEASTLKPVIESLSDDQLGAILDVLTKPQKIAFQNMLAAIPDTPRGKMNGSNGSSDTPIESEDPPDATN